MKTILLKLSGPMQSWGTTSNYNIRETDYYPSKSGVIGIIAASIGIDRENDDAFKELNKLGFAVRIDQQGTLSKDFQIAKEYTFQRKEKNVHLVNRYYMEDAIYLVAISGEDELIDKVYTSLQDPIYQPYMGRKSCPLPADFLVGIYDKNPISLLKDLEWQALDWYKKENNDYLATIYADKKLLDGRARLRSDIIVSLSAYGRKYNPRLETSTMFKLNNKDVEENMEIYNSDFFTSVEG